MPTLDCTGLPCPQPVLKTREYLKSAVQSFTILIDNMAAVENVSRFLTAQNCSFTIHQKNENLFILSVTLKESSTIFSTTNMAKTLEAGVFHKTLLFIGSETIGDGEIQLGHGLMKNFIATLPEMNNLWRIVLVNSGVKLAIAGSPVLDDLKKLTDLGISLLVCGTCLNFYNLLEQKQVGETTNMLDIVTSFELADKVIRL